MATNITAKFINLLVEVYDISSVENDGKSNGGQCKLGGHSGYLFNDLLIDPWLKLGHRCTVESHPNYGSFEKEDGIKKMIRDGLIDVAVNPTRIYETNDPAVEYSLPMYEDFLTMACAYKFNNEAIESDLMDAYGAFSVYFYLLLSATFLFLLLFWKCFVIFGKNWRKQIRKRIKNSRSPTCWVFIRAILDQDMFPDIRMASLTILSVLISFSFFFTIDCYMLNSMSTALVIPVEPVVVRTLDDIVRRDDVKLMFHKGMDEEEFFKHEPPGTVEYEVWNKKRVTVESFDTSTVARLWSKLVDQEYVAFMREWELQTIINIGITMTRQTGDYSLRALQTIDDKHRSFTVARLINSQAPQVLKDFIRKRTIKELESGILTWYNRERFMRVGDLSEINLDQFSSNNVFLQDQNRVIGLRPIFQWE